MKAKLIKNELPSGYFLYDEKGDLIASTIKGYKKQPLSLKNCQAIERGYDLDELAEIKHPISMLFDHHSKHRDKYDCNLEKRNAFIEGAKTILEILSDKKFSEKDMLKAFITGVFTDETSDHDFEFTELMKDLQQTEWEVTFNPDEKDSDGCLILKRL